MISIINTATMKPSFVDLHRLKQITYYSFIHDYSATVKYSSVAYHCSPFQFSIYPWINFWIGRWIGWIIGCDLVVESVVERQYYTLCIFFILAIVELKLLLVMFYSFLLWFYNISIKISTCFDTPQQIITIHCVSWIIRFNLMLQSLSNAYI